MNSVKSVEMSKISVGELFSIVHTKRSLTEEQRLNHSSAIIPTLIASFNLKSTCKVT